MIFVQSKDLECISENWRKVEIVLLQRQKNKNPFLFNQSLECVSENREKVRTFLLPLQKRK